MSVTLCRGDGSDEYYAYRLSDEEKALLLPKMEEYCKQQTGMSLKDYCEKQLAEEREAEIAQKAERAHPQNNAKRRQEER